MSEWCETACGHSRLQTRVRPALTFPAEGDTAYLKDRVARYRGLPACFVTNERNGRLFHESP